MRPTFECNQRPFVTARRTVDPFEIGNHDNRHNFFDVFPLASKDEHFVQGVSKTKSGPFIYIDTVHQEAYGVSKSHAGFYDDERFEWLECQLKISMKNGEKASLFMHHHPRDIFVTPCDTIGFNEKDTFRLLVEKYKEAIRYIFFGHCHMQLSGTLNGIPFSSLRGTNHQVIPDFGKENKFKVAALNPTYNVVFFDNDDVIIHSIDYTFDGRFDEIGTTWNEWEATGS